MKKSLLATLPLLMFALIAGAQVPVMTPISGPSVVCSSPAGHASFTVSASNTPTLYNWSVFPSVSYSVFLGTGGSTISVAFPKGSGTYTIYCQATNSSGSSVPVMKVITVHEMPTVSFSGLTSFCQGSPTFLMASATMYSGSSTLSYLWQPSTGLSNQASSTVYANPPSSITYTLYVNTGFCQNEISIPLTVLPLPQYTVNIPRNPICQGETSLISLTGGSLSYSVNGNAVTGTSFAVSPSSSTNYTVSAQHQNGCMLTQSFTQNVDLCLAVQKAKENAAGLQVFPNPSAGSLTIRNANGGDVLIINQLGETVRKMSIPAGAEEKITDLQNGIYFIVTPGITARVIVAR